MSTHFVTLSRCTYMCSTAKLPLNFYSNTPSPKSCVLFFEKFPYLFQCDAWILNSYKIWPKKVPLMSTNLHDTIKGYSKWDLKKILICFTIYLVLKFHCYLLFVFFKKEIHLLHLRNSSTCECYMPWIFNYLRLYSSSTCFCFAFEFVCVFNVYIHMYTIRRILLSQDSFAATRHLLLQHPMLIFDLSRVDLFSMILLLFSCHWTERVIQLFYLYFQEEETYHPMNILSVLSSILWSSYLKCYFFSLQIFEGISQLDPRSELWKFYATVCSDYPNILKGLLDSSMDTKKIW